MNPKQQAKMMKQLQKMQREMAETQEQLAEETVEATAGGGMVTAVASGDGDLKELRIDPEAVDPDDVEMLQDLVVAAVSEALRSAHELAEQRMGAVTAGMPNMPGMF